MGRPHRFGKIAPGFLRVIMAVKTRAMTSKEQGRLLEEEDGHDDSVDGGSANRVRERELEIQSLKLQMDLRSREIELRSKELELERLKLETRSPGETGARGSRCRVGEYASELRAVLAPMPDMDAMVPSWFKNVDVLFASLEIPLEVQGAVILPFLTERVRSFVASQSRDAVLAYPELKELVLRELRLTANEYKRLFVSTRKGEAESWSQFATTMETI